MPKPLAVFRPAAGSQARCACWAALAAGLALLAACNSQPAATTASQPALPALVPPPPPVGDTAATVTLTPQDTLRTAALGKGDVPALHKPFTDVQTVAPGLQVIVSSVPVPATQVIHEPSELRLVLTIRRHGQVIFRDTTDDGLAYAAYSEPSTTKLYPLWIPTGVDSGELLVAYSYRPLKDQARRFHLRGSHVVGIDSLLTFDGPARDVDRDGRLEFAGFYSYGEQWQDAQGRTREMYVPTLYYEVRPSGLVLDSALTKRRARGRYGGFYGFKDSDQPVLYAK